MPLCRVYLQAGDLALGLIRIPLIYAFMLCSEAFHIQSTCRLNKALQGYAGYAGAGCIMHSAIYSPDAAKEAGMQSRVYIVAT